MEIPFQTGMHHTTTHIMPITPGLWQCITVWSTKEIHKILQTAQNMCSKLVLKCSKYSSKTQALMDLHWLQIVMVQNGCVGAECLVGVVECDVTFIRVLPL